MSNPPRPVRPWSVTLLLLGVLTYTGLNVARAFLSINQWSYLSSLPGVSPAYLVVSGAVWAVAGLIVTWGLWRAGCWAVGLVRVFSVVLVVFIWFERVFLSGQGRPAWPENGLFLLIISIVLLVFVFWSTASAKSKLFFGVIDERTS